jgi:hypothetical protein
MKNPPTQHEVDRIELAWGVLEAVTAAMGAEQEYELLKVQTLVFQQVHEWGPEGYASLLAKAMMMSMVRDGIRKKIEVGEDNDTFYRAGLNPGFSEAHELGQKLVRWNRLIERRLLDRLLARKGPLEPLRVLVILDAAHQAARSWEARA